MNGEKSIAKNSIYYLFYQVFNVLFPFVTSVYAARVLLPEAVGKVLSAQNIASYFAILAFLGLPTYGRREISKARSSREELSRLYSELIIINTVSTLFFGIFYLVLIFSVPDFRDNLPLYLVTGGAVALNFLNNSWLFEGLEDFRFISIRNIVFKLLAIILLFVFVKSQDDYLIYALIMTIGTAGNYILNIFYTPRLVKFTLKGLELKKHMRPVFTLVAVNLAIELYSLVDVTMLRIFKSEENVAYYFYAQAINKVLQQVINTFTIVVVPRLALYFKDGQKDKFDRLVSRALNTIILLALPMICGIRVVADSAVIVFFGSEFGPSIPVLRLLIILLTISPVGYLLGSRVLLVTGHETQMALCVGAGAVINIIGNAILIPRYSEMGAAAASVISEVIVAGIYIFLGGRYCRPSLPLRNLSKILLSAFVMTVTAFAASYITSDVYVQLAVQIVSGALTYFLMLLLTRESMVTEYTRTVISKFRR